ncbi:GAF domain-containing sensor histidine kinase [Chroococcus sp. FPU101]|uniref:GAF domain-containing sensor histidine kinase n=1 Tax=Chroococcus sp. FPU101 TaxID=1974212 RepID=UPI001F5D1FAC|nr:GAF domain-containing sensor histidine kinase [Chroococcus sp. FPU101]
MRKFTGYQQEGNDFFQELVIIIQKVCDVDYCLLLLFEKEEIKQVYSTIKSTQKKQILIEFGQYFYQQNQIYLERDQILSLVIQHPLIPLKLKKGAQQLQINTINLIPIQYQQLSLGFFCIYSKHNQIRWTEKNIEIIRYLVEQSIKIILHKQKLNKEKCYQELFKKINQQLNDDYITSSKLTDILQEIAIIFEVEQILILKVADCNCQKLNLKIPQIYSNESATTQAKAFESWQIYQAYSKALETEIDDYNIDYFCLDNLCEAQQIKFYSEVSRIIKPENLVFKYHLCSLPILIKGEFFGALILQSKQYNREFSEEELSFLKQITKQIGIAIYQIRIQEQLTAKQENSKHTNEYFSNMTHELRAPLAGILGFARMLQEQIYGSLNPKQSQYVNAVVSSGEHLMAIVNDLLDLSKIDANREELFLEKLAVEDLCLAALSIVQAKAEQQGLEINLEIAFDVDFCFADQQRFKQILINLLSNAIKFTERGNVTLRVTRQKNSLTFLVIDTGIGITLADQEKLFQPFQQLKSSVSHKHKGTGLGLALSQKLAQLHGGKITLISEVGQGSCFTVELPHADEPINP